MGLKLKIFLIGLVSYILSFTLFLSFIMEFEFDKVNLNDIYLASAISLSSLIIPYFVYLHEKTKLFWKGYDSIINKIFETMDLETLDKIKNKELPKLKNNIIKTGHIHEYDHIKVLIGLRCDLIKTINQGIN